ncbi:MAG TPA: septum site-determining protein MinD, partial [Lachnospiraceae bacterium]|nr:septum site-determining protein MinD [Lachnospiraceae bacterium]
YENICKRIMGEEVPLLDLSKGNGFFSKIKSKFKNN